jgi:hypothetical protein
VPLGLLVSFSVMVGKIEQYVCIKFCTKISKSPTETLEMLCEALGEQSSSRTVVLEWHSCFRASQVSAEEDEHSGRPSTIKTTQYVEKFQELIHKDHRRTIHELADTVGISY